MKTRLAETPRPGYILGLETSTLSGGASLLSIGRQSDEENSRDLSALSLVGSVNITTRQLYSQRLLPSIEWLLDRAQVSMSDIKVFGVAVGPGSFTGLRIGLSVAKALAYASGGRIIGVSTLQALAVRASGGRDAVICPLLDARHGQVYSGLYQVCWNAGLPQVNILQDDWAGPLEQIADWIDQPVLLAGDAAIAGCDMLKSKPGVDYAMVPAHLRLPSSDDVAMLTASRIREGRYDDATILAPHYVRQSYTKS